ncbi:MAG: SCP2 sterol-binding domain-containing protein [Gaiellaceae bacterium]
MTSTFFDELAHAGHEPILARTSGTLRIELKDGRQTEYWYVTIRKGDIEVSHANDEADAVVRTDKAHFEGMATGRVNATTAILRGVLDAEGDLGLVMSFERLFPSPPKSVYARKIR